MGIILVDKAVVSDIEQKDYSLSMQQNLLQHLIQNGDENVLESPLYQKLSEKVLEATKAFQDAKSKMFEQVKKEITEPFTNWSLDYYTCEFHYE